MIWSGVESVHRPQFRPQRRRLRVGIQPQPAIKRAAQRLQHFRRRRIRILVRVELGQPGDLRLLAGHVAAHLLNGWSRVTHREPNPRRRDVRIQAFHRAECLQRRQRFLQRVPRQLHDARAAAELIHRQSRAVLSGAASRQLMARSGQIIAHDRRRPRANEDRAGSLDLRAPLWPYFSS